jgi:hypothetical protein
MPVEIYIILIEIKKINKFVTAFKLFPLKSTIDNILLILSKFYLKRRLYLIKFLRILKNF